MVEMLAYRQVINSQWMDDPQYLPSIIQTLQYKIGGQIVAHLWSQEGPFILELTAEENREPSPRYWDEKELVVRARMNPVRIERYDLEYVLPQPVIHVPHFRYFPADWVCKKCGCIVNGLLAPRLCERCGAPRDARAAMIEAMSP